MQRAWVLWGVECRHSTAEGIGSGLMKLQGVCGMKSWSGVNWMTGGGMSEVEIGGVDDEVDRRGEDVVHLCYAKCSCCEGDRLELRGDGSRMTRIKITSLMKEEEGRHRSEPGEILYIGPSPGPRAQVSTIRKQAASHAPSANFQNRKRRKIGVKKNHNEKGEEGVGVRFRAPEARRVLNGESDSDRFCARGGMEPAKGGEMVMVGLPTMHHLRTAIRNQETGSADITGGRNRRGKKETSL
ncbi:hypothetical protein BDZ94DRAFT_1240534 [Collybia nuda]|uniref:Uncharacterized protein n=1 Tax=Collybia nuda TaxID=64659 RepID=A0A9P5XWA1_9AGAR|nr:hypothetical protein BDZ94DRAFT_1240534 [Collybia nuda]